MTTCFKTLKPPTAVQQMAAVLMFAVLYYAVGEYSLLLGRMDVGHVTAIWPAAGLGFAVLYVYGYRFAASILLSELSNVFLESPAEIPQNLITACGNTFALLLSVWLFKRCLKTEIPFTRVRHAVWFLAVGVGLASLLSASIGTFALSIYSPQTAQFLLNMGWTWLLADMVGILIVAPLFISFYYAYPAGWYRPHWTELGVLLLSLSLLSGLIFWQVLYNVEVRAYPLPFALMPFLLWAAFRFGLRETLLSMLLLAVIAVGGTLQGKGPFSGYSTYESLLLLQAFIGVMGIMALFLTAVISERSALEKHLYDANFMLEQRVLERTESLRRSTEKYQSIFENAIEGIYQVAPDGTVLNANPALAKMFNYSTPQAFIEAMPCIETLYVDALQRNVLLQQLQQLGKVQGFEIEVFRKDGDSMWITENSRAVHDQYGRLLHYEGTMLDITERKEAQVQLYQWAHHDPLTGLMNRRLFEIRLKQALAHAKNSEKQGILMYFDLDGFKRVNDQLGHEFGDELLKMVAQRLRTCLRELDVICRLGGDEFTVLAEHVARREHAEIVAKKLLAHISQPYEYQGKIANVGVSIGISFFDGHSYDTNALIQQADQAMYQAKQAGKGRFCFYGEGVV